MILPLSVWLQNGISIYYMLCFDIRSILIEHIFIDTKKPKNVCNINKLYGTLHRLMLVNQHRVIQMTNYPSNPFSVNCLALVDTDDP